MVSRGLVVAVAVSAMVGSFSMSLRPASAFEERCVPNCVAPNEWSHNTTGSLSPLVFVIGDSISAELSCLTACPGSPLSQHHYFFATNDSYGWQTRVWATGGWDIDFHKEVGSFSTAATSGVKAVYVEVGTNDIGGMNHQLALHIDADDPADPTGPSVMTKDEVSRDWTAIDTAVNKALSKLGTNTCVVWQGLNAYQDSGSIGSDGIYNEKGYAQQFNHYINSLRKTTYPNLHLADYTTLVGSDSTLGTQLAKPGTYRSGFDQILIHPQSAKARQELATFAAMNIQHYC
jgi:hypothetical protein